MDDELDRILLGGIKARGLEDEALDFGFFRAGEPEGLERLHGNLGKNRVVEMSKRFVTNVCLLLWFCSACPSTKYVNFVGMRNRHLREQKRIAVRRHDQIVVMTGHHLNHSAIDFYSIDRRFSLTLRAEKQPLGISPP